jgi:hypothetical protein
MRAEMQGQRRWRPTTLDGMLHDDESRVLELWAENEMFLDGRVASSSLSDARGSGRSEISPIPDGKVKQVMRHMEFRKTEAVKMHAQILETFAGMQNRHEGALSATQYGLVFCPDARDKERAFFQLIRNAAKILVDIGY